MLRKVDLFINPLAARSTYAREYDDDMATRDLVQDSGPQLSIRPCGMDRVIWMNGIVPELEYALALSS